MGAIIGIVIGVAMFCLVVGVIIGFLIKGKPEFCRRSQNKGQAQQDVVYYNTESSSNRDPSNAINTENGYIGVYSELDDVNRSDRAYANVDPYESIPQSANVAKDDATERKDYVNIEGNGQRNENKEYEPIWGLNPSVANA